MKHNPQGALKHFLAAAGAAYFVLKHPSQPSPKEGVFLPRLKLPDDVLPRLVFIIL